MHDPIQPNAIETDAPATNADSPRRPFWMTGSARILGALILGMIVGILMSRSSDTGFIASSVTIAQAIGNLWLNALKMTIVPLVVALLVMGIGQTAAAAKAGRIAGRSVMWILAVLWGSTALTAVVVPAVLNLFPMPVEAAASLRQALSGAQQISEVPSLLDFVKNLVPANVVKAAVDDAMVPLILFTTTFAFAITRLPEARRAPLTDFFAALTDAMIVMIQWILLLGPIGVFALAYTVAAQTGTAALGALAHYVTIVTAVGALVLIGGYVIAVLWARIPLAHFARAMVPAQAVALSTQSSLASLPPMLRATQALGMHKQVADITLPLAVAIFRATGPGMNLAVALYVAHWYGITLTPLQIGAGVVTAALTTMGAVSLPGTVSFISSIAPICVAMGLPVEPLALLIAVETIPDLMRTLGNVTMDVAVTGAVNQGQAGKDRAQHAMG